MTRRGAALLLAPLPLVALGTVVPALFALGLAGVAVATLAVVLDHRRAPGRDRLSATRAHDDVLAVGRANPVLLRIDVEGDPGGGEALIRDEFPPSMTASTAVVHLRLPGAIAYTLTPPARGTFSYGRTVVRTSGPWGLARRQTALGAPQPVRVDPDLSGLRMWEALVRRGQLTELGVRALRRAGEGTAFERVRDAVPDDPLRSINWKATARTGRLMASDLMPERAQPVLVCLDHGRLMGVGAGTATKLDHAINAALLLAHVALRSGDRVGLLGFDDHVTAALTPRAGDTQLRAILDALQPLRAGDTEADYAAAFARLDHVQRRRALLVIFTDVLDPDQGAELVRQCRRLRRRHLAMVITVRDPALDEIALRRPNDPDSTYQRAIAGRLLRERDEVLYVLRGSGVDTIDADARSLSPRLVNRYLELKRRAAL